MRVENADGLVSSNMCDIVGMLDSYPWMSSRLDTHIRAQALIHLYSATAGMSESATLFIYAVALTTSGIVIHYGEGHHAWEVSDHDYSQFLKVSPYQSKPGQ